MRTIILLLFATVMSIGCDIDMSEGQFECLENEDCPDNWTCEADKLCYKGTNDKNSDSDTDSSSDSDT